MWHPAALSPLLVIVGLTFLVWLRMDVVRIRRMRHGRIHPQSIATATQAATHLTESAADNVRNLFELPVLFYVAIAVVMFGAYAMPVFLLLAWGFVVLRVVHSLVHCTYGRVMHRFAVHVASSVSLWSAWAYPTRRIAE